MKHTGPYWKAKDIRKCLELLQRAGIAATAVHSEGNGVPLGANEDPTVAKLFHLDIGLVGTATGIGIGKLDDFKNGRFINEGKRPVRYSLWNMPLYLAERVRELMERHIEK
ncbi:MAG: hypothetical protein WCT14_05835 [Treponemataceae bacterium]